MLAILRCIALWPAVSFDYSLSAKLRMTAYVQLRQKGSVMLSFDPDEYRERMVEARHG
jgi:hypothetical protein